MNPPHVGRQERQGRQSQTNVGLRSRTVCIVAGMWNNSGKEVKQWK